MSAPVAGVPPAVMPSPAMASNPSTGGVALVVRVLGPNAQGALIEVRGEPWQLLVPRGPTAGALQRGMALRLDGATIAADGTGSARLSTVGGRPIEPPLPVRLRADGAAQPVRESPDAAVGVRVELRVVGPDGRARGPVWSVQLRAAITTGRGAVTPLPPAPTDAPAAVGGATISAPASPSSPSGAPSASPVPPLPVGSAPDGVPPEEVANVASWRAAEMAGRDPLGRPLLRVAGQLLVALGDLDLPIGARLQIRLPTVATPSVPTLPDAPPESSSDDPVEALAATLRQRARSAQADGLRLPRPSAGLAARLLRVIGALAEAVRAPATDLAPQAAADPPAPLRAALLELGRASAETQPGGWRLWLLPVAFDDTTVLRLYLRDDPSEREGSEHEAGKRRTDGSRALFAIDLSDLGRCQLDVLCQARRFDLLVRTERRLEPAVERDIRDLYQAARDAAGWAGEVGFRPRELIALPATLPRRERRVVA